VALYVHLTDVKNVPAIRRGGIAMSRYGGGVHAMPVTPNFVVSHQWLRELRRFRARPQMVGVYFRIGDDEPVRFGRYNDAPVTLTAAAAAASVMQAPDPLALQVIIPRKIAAKEIHAIRHLPQTIGWRYDPRVRNYFCGCIMCIRPGTINGKRKRKAYQDRENAEARRRDAAFRRRLIEEFRDSEAGRRLRDLAKRGRMHARRLNTPAPAR
jgi:hypothetical protein